MDFNSNWGCFREFSLPQIIKYNTINDPYLTCSNGFGVGAGVGGIEDDREEDDS